MTDDPRYAKAITACLDHGVSELKPGIAYRLQQARAAALARLEAPVAVAEGQLATAPRLAGAGGGQVDQAQPAGRPLYTQVKLWLAIAIVAAAALGYEQWRAWQELEALEDLDVQLLSSDLPIDAYVDRGFQLWLRTPPMPPTPGE
jgi:hypothetical protein